MTTTFYYDNRRAGAGKTHDQLTRIAEQHGLYIFAVDRREVMQERQASLEKAAEKAGTRVHVIQIRSRQHDVPGGVDNVRVEVEALPNIYKSGHVAVLITHAALKSAMLEEFSDWHLVVDEAPSFWDRTAFRTSISASLLSKLFDLKHGEHATRILARRRLPARELRLDSLAAPLAALHARASDPRQQVLTSLCSWDELAQSPEWTAYTLWAPLALSTFKSVTILAADFDRSMTLALCRAQAPEIEWATLGGPPAARPYSPRTLNIRYFADAHGATRGRFDSEKGREALNSIAGHLALRPRTRIWTCNLKEESLLRPRLPRGFLKPQQAGSNAWAGVHEAAMMYTAKPDPGERKILTALGVDPQVVVATREHDAIYQFVARTSIRDPNSTESVTAYVYDRVQANALAAAFARQHELQIELELVDLGFAFDVPQRQSREHLSLQEKAELQRAQARERKRAQRERERSERSERTSSGDSPSR